MTLGFVIFAIAPFAVFLALYVRVRFWKDAAGWSVFVLTLVVVIVLSLVLARYAGWMPPDGLRELIYGLIGLAGWVQLFAYLYTRHGFRRDYRNRRLPFRADLGR